MNTYITIFTALIAVILFIAVIAVILSVRSDGISTRRHREKLHVRSQLGKLWSNADQVKYQSVPTRDDIKSQMLDEAHPVDTDASRLGLIKHAAENRTAILTGEAILLTVFAGAGLVGLVTLPSLPSSPGVSINITDKLSPVIDTILVVGVLLYEFWPVVVAMLLGAAAWEHKSDTRRATVASSLVGIASTPIIAAYGVSSGRIGVAVVILAGLILAGLVLKKLVEWVDVTKIGLTLLRVLDKGVIGVAGGLTVLAALIGARQYSLVVGVVVVCGGILAGKIRHRVRTQTSDSDQTGRDSVVIQVGVIQTRHGDDLYCASIQNERMVNDDLDTLSSDVITYADGLMTERTRTPTISSYRHTAALKGTVTSERAVKELRQTIRADVSDWLDDGPQPVDELEDYLHREYPSAVADDTLNRLVYDERRIDVTDGYAYAV